MGFWPVGEWRNEWMDGWREGGTDGRMDGRTTAKKLSQTNRSWHKLRPHGGTAHFGCHLASHRFNFFYRVLAYFYWTLRQIALLIVVFWRYVCCLHFNFAFSIIVGPYVDIYIFTLSIAAVQRLIDWLIDSAMVEQCCRCTSGHAFCLECVRHRCAKLKCPTVSRLLSAEILRHLQRLATADLANYVSNRSRGRAFLAWSRPLKRCQSLFDPTHRFSYRVHGKIAGKWPTRGFSAITR